MSMSDGVMYWVPETHWKFEMVGRGGMSALGLKRVSWRRGLDSSQHSVNVKDKQKNLQWLSGTPNINLRYLRWPSPPDDIS